MFMRHSVHRELVQFYRQMQIFSTHAPTIHSVRQQGLLQFLYPICDLMAFCRFLSRFVRCIYTNEGIIVSVMGKFFVSSYFMDID